VTVAAPVQHAPEGAGFVALSLLIHEWDAMAPWLIGQLFPDGPQREAFAALAAAEGDVHSALRVADEEAVAIIERAAVYDSEADPFVEARSLIAAAVRREMQVRRPGSDMERVRRDREVRLALEQLSRPDGAVAAAVELLGWLAVEGAGGG
jgi:hypothetical protein